MSAYEYRVVSATRTGSGNVYDTLAEAKRALTAVTNMKRKGVKYHIERREVTPWEPVQ